MNRYLTDSEIKVIKDINNSRTLDEVKKLSATERFELACRFCHDWITNDSTGSTGSRPYKYCSLKKVLKFTRNILNAYGFHLFQYTSYKDETSFLETIILDSFEIQNKHEQNRDFKRNAIHKVVLPLPKLEGPKILQGIGEALTYLKRYSIYTILNFHPDDDMDGKIEKEKVKKKASPYLNKFKKEVNKKNHNKSITNQKKTWEQKVLEDEAREFKKG